MGISGLVFLILGKFIIKAVARGLRRLIVTIIERALELVPASRAAAPLSP